MNKKNTYVCIISKALIQKKPIVLESNNQMFIFLKKVSKILSYKTRKIKENYELRKTKGEIALRKQKNNREN